MIYILIAAVAKTRAALSARKINLYKQSAGRFKNQKKNFKPPQKK